MKYPAGECLTITPFISILNINEFPLGWFPLSPPFSISLCLSFISIALPPLPERQPKTQPSQSYSGTRRANLDDFRKTSACVCSLENANVYARRGSHGVTAATESWPPLFNTKGIIFGDVGANERVLTGGFYVRRVVVSQRLQRLELICNL